MSTLKRIFALALALVLMTSCLPAAAMPTLAADTETIAVETNEEPAAEATEEATEAPTEEGTEAPAEEPTEEAVEDPAEEPTENPTEEATEAPAEEPTEESVEEPAEEATVEATEEAAALALEEEESPESLKDRLFANVVRFVPDCDGLPSDDELFAGFVDMQFQNVGARIQLGVPATYGNAAGKQLNGDTKKVYDALVPILRKIANGERTPTSIVLASDPAFEPDVYVSFNDNNFYQDPDFLNDLLLSLLEDLPYEMYWFDKTTGLSLGWATDNYGNTAILLAFAVSEYFAAGQIDPMFGFYDNVNTYITGSAKKAAANAKTVANQISASVQGDYQKLSAFRNWICNAVTYDYDAAQSGDFSKNCNPWQLINVFDNDPSTNVVCEGYSKAFQYLCDISKFDKNVVVYTVTGDMYFPGGGGGHMWNIVRFNGKSYLVDVTNTEPDSRFLFMAGGVPNSNGDYQFSDITFSYDNEATSLWGGTGVLVLARTDYDPSGDIVILSKPAKPYKIANVVSGVHVYWKAVSGAAKYGLWRSENGVNGTYKWIANPTVPHFTDTSVESGKTYYYRVTAMTNGGTASDRSDAIGITYVSTPDITSRRNVAAGVELSWNKIPGATGYAIYRKSFDGDDAWVRIATISGNSTFSWTDTSMKNNNGEICRYTIRALAGSNMKTLSGCRNTGRTMVRLSSQVLKSAAKASATSVKCSWTTSSRVTGYEMRFMVGNTVYKTFTVGNWKTGVKTFTGLSSGQTYTVQVRTYKKVDGVGSFYSDWSAPKTVSLK